MPRDLEAEADDEKPDTEHQHLLALAVTRDTRGDGVEPRARRPAVDESDAEEQEPGRKRAEEKVLERRLVGADLLAPHAGQHVHRDRHHLESEKDHDEVGRRGHHHHPRRREQHQRVILAPAHGGGGEKVDRHQNGENTRDAEQQIEEHRVLVDDEGTAEEDSRDKRPKSTK